MVMGLYSSAPVPPLPPVVWVVWVVVGGGGWWWVVVGGGVPPFPPVVWVVWVVWVVVGGGGGGKSCICMYMNVSVPPSPWQGIIGTMRCCVLDNYKRKQNMVPTMIEQDDFRFFYDIKWYPQVSLLKKQHITKPQNHWGTCFNHHLV